MTWKKNWEIFEKERPFKDQPYCKRNWGSPNHSLCSFYGKLKPSISHFLVKTFTNEGDNLFDCFAGSGTIPYEGALNKRKTFAIDINPISVVLTSAKIQLIDRESVINEIEKLSDFIKTNKVDIVSLAKAKSFGYNKTLVEYFHPETLIEILLARKYFSANRNYSANQNFILACLIHILHGNRPYALSRRSHPITPYSPTGDFEYKNLIEKLLTKVNKGLNNYDDNPITPGKVYQHDILKNWPSDIDNINAIICSPPFFDSTKYYQTNWIRSWFLGWEFEDFENEKDTFVDTIQKKSFSVYDIILKSSKERIVDNGVVVFHLGKSHKKDMAEAILPYAKKYFNNCKIYNEDVSEIEKHGIEDKGSVTVHQYMIMY